MVGFFKIFKSNMQNACQLYIFRYNHKGILAFFLKGFFRLFLLKRNFSNACPVTHFPGQTKTGIFHCLGEPFRCLYFAKTTGRV